MFDLLHLTKNVIHISRFYLYLVVIYYMQAISSVVVIVTLYINRSTTY